MRAKIEHCVLRARDARQFGLVAKLLWLLNHAALKQQSCLRQLKHVLVDDADWHGLMLGGGSTQPLYSMEGDMYLSKRNKLHKH